MKATEEHKAVMRQYNKEHADVINERAKKWARDNIERKRENGKRWRENNPNYFKQHYAGRTVRFKDKRIWLKENPRKGICTDCGKPGRTNLHHEEYDENDPLAHTIELCVGCHQRQHRIMKYSEGLYKKQS